MNDKAYINFSELYESGKLSTDLLKELKNVEGTLNLTPTVKKDGRYIPSPTNISVMSFIDTTVRKIASMVDQGLSYASGDYYIFVQFGGKPSVTKSPNGIIRAMNKLASKHGYIANINTGCVFTGYESLKVIRDGLIDKLELVNNYESEIGVEAENDILAPYAVVTLVDKQSSKVISSKVTIVRNGEYLEARKQGSSTHYSYPVPMAEKIALKRAGEQMAASLGIDDSVELEALDRELIDHNSEYDLDRKEPNKEDPDKITDEQVLEIDVFVEENDIDGNYQRMLKSWGINSTKEIWASNFNNTMNQLKQAAEAK